MFPHRRVKVLARFEPPKPLGYVKVMCQSYMSLRRVLSFEDNRIVDKNWEERVRKYSYFYDGNLINPFSCYPFVDSYKILGRVTSYRYHQAQADAHENRLKLSDHGREKISSLAVSALVVSSDEKIPVRKRTEATAHGKYDCSAAGLCPTKHGKADLPAVFSSIMKRELGLEKRDLSESTVIGVSEVFDYHAIIVHHRVRMRVSSEDMNNKAGGLTWLHAEELPHFILENYPDVVDDLVGAALLWTPKADSAGLANGLRARFGERVIIET